MSIGDLVEGAIGEGSGWSGRGERGVGEGVVGRLWTVECGEEDYVIEGLMEQHTCRLCYFIDRE